MIHTRREVGIKKTNSLVKAEKSHKVNRYISNNLGEEPREMDKWEAWKEFHKRSRLKDQHSRRVKETRRNYCIFGNISKRNSRKMVGLKSDYSGRRR